jgi:P pilus assembly chaperone PapD
LLFTIDAHKQQRVRTVFNSPAALTEKAYRIILEELPPPVEFNPTGPPHASVTIRSRFSLPVFLQPEKPTFAAKIDAASVKSGKLSLTVENTGTAHVKLSGFAVASASAGGATAPPQAVELGGVIFAGAHRTLSAPLPPAACKGTRILTITGLANDQKLVSTVTLDPGSCS